MSCPNSQLTACFPIIATCDFEAVSQQLILSKLVRRRFGAALLSSTRPADHVVDAAIIFEGSPDPLEAEHVRCRRLSVA
jgi:hypothetical protein